VKGSFGEACVLSTFHVLVEAIDPVYTGTVAIVRLELTFAVIVKRPARRDARI
jgi:hypothetical protein